MPEPLTIMTWLWAQPGGRVVYTAQHVNIWAAMVRRNLTIPFELACVTDMPDGLDPDIRIIAPPRDFEGVRLPTWGPDRPQCLRRIALFRRDAAEVFGAQRFVSMDMDCLISENIDSLFTRTEEIVLYATPPYSPLKSARRPYNGSMVMMTAGARPQVFDRFTPDAAVFAGRRYIGSDQAWISYVLGHGEAVWCERDGVVWWGRWKASDIGSKVIFFPGFPKPHDLVKTTDFVKLHYHLDEPGTCLVLGHGETVWDDLQRALDRGPFAAVIASPEAAEHYPGKVDAIAHDDADAERLVMMRGFRDVVFCGRSAAA